MADFWRRRQLINGHKKFKALTSFFLNFFRNFEHKHHGVFGLVAESLPDDVDSLLVGYSLEGNVVHRNQLKSSLRHKNTVRGNILIFLASKIVILLKIPKNSTDTGQNSQRKRT